MTRALVRVRPWSSRISSHSPSSRARSASTVTPLRRQTSSSPPWVERGLFEGHGQPLGAGFVFARFGFERRAQRRGEPTPAPARQVGEVLLERIDACVRLGGIDVLGRQRDAFGVHDHADGAWLTIGRAGVFGDLRDLGRDEVAVAQGADEFEMQLRKAQRQALAGRPATGRGPDDERIGCSVLAQASETSFDRSSCKAPHVVRLAVEPHPGGQRRANLRR